MPGDGLGLRSSKGRQPAPGPSEWPRPRPFFCDGHGNRGGAEAPLEGKGEDAHVDLEWKGQRSAGAGASPPPGPSLRSLGSSSSAQDGTGPSQPEALQTRGKGQRKENGVGGGGDKETRRKSAPIPRERRGRGFQPDRESPEARREESTPGKGGEKPDRPPAVWSRSPAPRLSWCLSTQGRWSTFDCSKRSDPCAPLVSYLRSQFLSGEGVGAARSKLWRSGRPHKCFSLRWR